MPIRRPRVLDHNDGVCAIGDGRSGHDLGGLASGDGDAGDVLAGGDFGDDFQPGGDLRDILGANGEAIAGGTRKRRQIAVRVNFFGEDASGGGEQVDTLAIGQADGARVFFDEMARGFKRENGHGSIETFAASRHNGSRSSARSLPGSEGRRELPIMGPQRKTWRNEQRLRR